MRITLFGLAAIAIIGAIIVFVGPLFISTDDLRNTLFAQVESATGYRLRVSGPVQVSLFPSLDLVAEDVGIAQSGAAATCRDGHGQVAALRLAAFGAARRQGQDDRDHADRSGHRRARGAEGGQGWSPKMPPSRNRDQDRQPRRSRASASTGFSSRTAR